MRLEFLFGLGLTAALATAAYADDRSEICVRGHAASLRLSAHEYYVLRDAAFARAGIPTRMQCHKNDPRSDCYVVDHVIPLELCLASDNCNGLDNIQVQTRADADAKDHQIEDKERARYCRGDETRAQALSHFKRSVP